MQVSGVQDLRILLQGYFGYNFPSRTNSLPESVHPTPWYEELHVESPAFYAPFSESPELQLRALRVSL